MGLGFGAQWGRELILRSDLTVLVREFLAVGFASSVEEEVEAGWRSRVVRLEDLDPAERRRLLAEALSRGWQPADARQRRAVLDAGLEEALLSEADRLGWTPPTLRDRLP